MKSSLSKLDMLVFSTTNRPSAKLKINDRRLYTRKDGKEGWLER